jgi:hypothetical protein
MNREENTSSGRLTTEIIRSIATALLDKAEELERLQNPTETEPPRPHADNDALYL